MTSLTYRQVAEAAIGRKLKSEEIVHHINGDHSDNRRENLLICDAREGHALFHRILSLGKDVVQHQTEAEEKLWDDIRATLNRIEIKLDQAIESKLNIKI